MSVAGEVFSGVGPVRDQELAPALRWWRVVLSACRRDLRFPLFGGLLLLIYSLCLAAPLIAPFPPLETHTDDRNLGPTPRYLLGTDQLGRDMFSRVLYGGRVSLPAGLFAVAVSAAIGVVLGVVTGYAGGWLDLLVGRWVDAQLAFPGLLALIALVSAVGRNIWVIMFCVGFLAFPGYYRLARGQVLQVREYDYVHAARALGAPVWRLMFRHILPNSLNPLIVQTSLACGGAVLTLAGLSFLGVGPTGGTPDWGKMFQEGLDLVRIHVWLCVGPGVMVFLTVLAFYMLGDALRDLIDPRLRGAHGAKR